MSRIVAACRRDHLHDSRQPAGGTTRRMGRCRRRRSAMAVHTAGRKSRFSSGAVTKAAPCRVATASATSSWAADVMIAGTSGWL